MKKKNKRRFSRVFSKDDARHYIIYAALDKLRVPSPFQKADAILSELKTHNLL